MILRASAARRWLPRRWLFGTGAIWPLARSNCGAHAHRGIHPRHAFWNDCGFTHAVVCVGELDLGSVDLAHAVERPRLVAIVYTPGLIFGFRPCRLVRFLARFAAPVASSISICMIPVWGCCRVR